MTTDSNSASPSSRDVNIALKNAEFKGYLSWEEIGDVIRTQNYDRLSRANNDTQNYVKWREETLECYTSIADFIKTNLLGFPIIESNSSVDKITAAPLDRTNLTSDLILVKNKFPYATTANIEHHVLWVLRDKAPESDEVVRFLNAQLPNYEFLFWENPPQRKTIPEVTTTITQLPFQLIST